MVCPKCSSKMPYEEIPCKFMKHDAICPSCGYCPDCDRIKQQSSNYPDDEGYVQHIESPMERFKSFPGGSHQLLRLEHPLVRPTASGSTYIEVTAVFSGKVSEPAGEGHVLVGYEDLPVRLSFSLDDVTGKMETILEPQKGFWRHLKQCYTPEAMEQLRGMLYSKIASEIDLAHLNKTGSE